MITTPDALAALVARARRSEAVALDTEFVWERTFYPALGLVQIGLGDDDVHLVDTVALPDLSPLAPLLEDAGVVKILHDAPQDLTILHRASGGRPLNVFDTRRAAGFVGLPSTISLGDLLRAALNVDLEKGETRTDWTRRPLSEAQTVYAQDDVRHMPALRRWLLAEAETRGRRAWVEEEMTLYDDPARYGEADPDPLDRVKGGGKLSPGQQAVLRELSAWREAEARRADRPRRFIVPDEPLVEAARRRPTNLGALGACGIPDKLRDRAGEALLDAIQRGLAAPPEGPRPPRPSRADEEKADARTALAAAMMSGEGVREGVDPALVATRADLRALVTDTNPEPERHAVLRGWRGEFAGRRLLDLLEGRGAVGLDPASGWPVALKS